MRENAILIDWLSITTKDTEFVQGFKELLGMPDGWQTLRGVRGYGARDWRDSISIHHHAPDRDDMGTWLEMSGSGCRAFETYGSGRYEDLLGFVIDNPETVNLTRLDVAFDDFTGLLDIARICDDTRQRKFRSKAEFWEVIESSNGQSLTVGSPQSKVLVRIYDKLAERLAKVQNPSDRDKIMAEISHWTRVELQLRDERAREFIKYLFHDNPLTETDRELSLGEAFSGVLRSYLLYGYSTTARGHPEQKVWHTFGYWEKMLNSSGALKIYRKPGIDYNFMRMERYLSYQAGNAIDTYVRIKGVGGLLDIVSRRETKQNAKYIDLMKRYGRFTDRQSEADKQYIAAVKDKDSNELILQTVSEKDPMIFGGEHYLLCQSCGRILPAALFSDGAVEKLASRKGSYRICNRCHADQFRKSKNVEDKL